MAGIVKIFLLAALAIAASWWMAELPGRVSADIAGYAIETSTPVALLALILVLLTGAIVVRLIGGLLRLPGLSGRWREIGRAHV